MRKQYCISRWPVFIFLIAWGLWSGATLRAQPRAATGPAGQYKVMVVEGLVEIARAGSQTFDAIQVNSWLYIGDRVRIGPNGKLTIQRLDNSVYRFDKKTEFVILAPRSTASTSPAMQVLSGVLYFLHRGKPELLEMLARRATAAVRGTEFELRVDETDTMVVTVIDGVVDLSNEVDTVAVQSGQQGTAEPGKAPVVRAAIDAANIIQWTLYYPGILDVDEIPLTADERTALRSSIDAYRAGDLLRAVSEYPAERQPGSDAERVYRAGLFVAVGQIADAQKLLGNVRTEAGDEGNVNARLVAALRNVIAAVKLAQTETKAAPQLASEWLAESYQLQSRADLEGALRAARSAVSKAPNFGFGWARVAELEFSFGRIDAATEAIQKSLQLAPRNAQAMALNGFLFAARNKLDSARGAFEEAIAADGRLANAWLGRGLVRIRKGDRDGGREDLLTAAAMEPQRAVLRSYLAKAWVDAGEEQLGEHELELAKKFDEHDPTAWLYSALLKEQQSRVNEAIRDLEKSQELNENRAVYRSRALIDQDRAVRSANLARLYSDAGLGDVAVREAGRGVAAAYGDYSSHVFLANSYEIERRANLSNFRFEAASVSENLIANLLGPANGRLLAQSVSQLNYGDLFERDRLGLYADTEYFSRGAWRHSSAQFGTYRGFSYSLEAEYQTDPGERINQDLEIRQLEAKLKYDLTLADSLYFHIIDTRSHGGDVSQHFDEAEIVPAFRFDIEATPTILAGYHHEWAPGNHTLLLAGRSEDILNTSSPIAGGFVEDLGGGMNNGLYPVILNQHLRSKVILYTGEAQQILTTGPNNLILGVTGQWGRQSITNQANNTLDSFYFYLLGFPDPVTIQPSVEVDSWVASAYAYDYFQVLDTLQLIGGVNYTRQRIPVSTTISPISSATKEMDQVSPKAGLVWTPQRWTSVRATYTRSLAGASFGQSVRLEPTHVAGLLQSFRDPAPPSIVGELNGAKVETIEALWELHVRDSYFSVAAQRLRVDRDRQLGMYFSSDDYIAGPTEGLLREDVRFQEEALEISAHQLLGNGFSFGARYRLAYADLRRGFPDYPNRGFGDLPDSSEWKGWLHTIQLQGIYRHHTGVFTRAEGIFLGQDRKQDGVAMASDDLWQVNLIAGYRFPRNQAEVSVGLLNVFDENYRLDPINAYAELPRSRTFYARLILNF